MRGEIVWLYAFDVADEIVMKGLETLLGQPRRALPIQGDRAFPRDVPIYQPLTFEFPRFGTLADRRPLRVLIKVFEVGVIALDVRTPFDVEDLRGLHSAHRPTLADGDSLDALARGVCQRVVRELDWRLRRSSPPSDPEAYTVFCLPHVEGESDVNAWLDRQRRDVAGLLTESDPSSLSEGQIAETLRIRRSFSHADLAVIDWDAALVVDLTGKFDDVLYVLELANLQLEEFRVMDQRLDRQLDQTYADLGRRPRLLFGQHARVLRTLRRIRIDLSRLADEVRHITKFLGDWYLARVYDGARERFYLDQWRASVDDRLHTLDELHRAVRDEVGEGRMLWLEVAIVILFVIDIAMLFLGRP